MMNAVFAVLFIQMQNGFCIAVGGITMALPCQQRAEIRIVVDFTVKHNPDTAVLISHRLMSSSDINDTEPAERHRQRSRRQNALIVRSAVTENTRHCRQISFRHAATAQVEDPTNATHGLRLLSCFLLE